MECIILFRNGRGQVGMIHDGYGEPEVFQNRDAALSFADSSPFLASVLWQIVELDEL